MQTFLVACFVAFVVTMLIVRLRHRHLAFTGDNLAGVQKFHTGAIPRIGGVGLLCGFIVAMAWSGWRGLVDKQALTLIGVALPAFAAGLAEDLSKRVGVWPRLSATAAAAALGAWLLGAQLPRMGVPGIDELLLWSPAGLMVTVVAVAGVANAVNIIDGFHGLAAATAMLMFVAFGYVAWALGDVFIVQLCLAMIGALLGFFLWNYPHGRIFLGDGGAYLVGFILAEVAVLMVVRHPNLSPWFCLLVCLYPITETIFSIYRKVFLRGISPGVPDALHLHMLIYRRLVRWAAGHAAARNITARNAATSPYLWVLTSMAVIPAVLFWKDERMLQASALLFVGIYTCVYAKLVRFRMPRWLQRRV